MLFVPPSWLTTVPSISAVSCGNILKDIDYHGDQQGLGNKVAANYAECCDLCSSGAFVHAVEGTCQFFSYDSGTCWFFVDNKGPRPQPGCVSGGPVRTGSASPSAQGGAVGIGWDIIFIGMGLSVLIAILGLMVNVLVLRKRRCSVRADQREDCFIPLWPFWFEFPRLVLDGLIVVFTLGKRKPTRTRGSGCCCVGIVEVSDASSWKPDYEESLADGDGDDDEADDETGVEPDEAATDEKLTPAEQVARNLAKLYEKKQRSSRPQHDYGAV